MFEVGSCVRCGGVHVVGNVASSDGFTRLLPRTSSGRNTWMVLTDASGVLDEDEEATSDDGQIPGTDEVSTAKLRSPLVAKWKSPLSAGCSVGQGLTSVAGSGLAHAVGLAGGDHGGGVVQEPVQEADGGRVFGQEPSPVLEAPV